MVLLDLEKIFDINFVDRNDADFFYCAFMRTSSQTRTILNHVSWNPIQIQLNHLERLFESTPIHIR